VFIEDFLRDGVAAGATGCDGRHSRQRAVPAHAPEEPIETHRRAIAAADAPGAKDER
jgi:hypothetical protein